MITVVFERASRKNHKLIQITLFEKHTYVKTQKWKKLNKKTGGTVFRTNVRENLKS